MPVYEVASWTASDALLKDKATLKPGFEFSIKVEGCLGGYYGLQEEDKKTAHIFVPWTKYEHHKNLMDDPVQYPIVMAKLKPAIGRGKFFMSHVEFNEDATAALNAPVTEILGVTLKLGHTRQEFDNIMSTITSKASSDRGNYGPAVWGPTIENPNKFWVLIGWKSSKAHSEAMSQEKYQGILQSLRDIADLKMVHASFWKHTELVPAPRASL